MQAGKGQSDSPAEAFAEGVEIVGGQAPTARLLNVSQPTVWRWLRKGKGCPADHVPVFSEATGISKERLRPELFGHRVLGNAHDTASSTPA